MIAFGGSGQLGAHENQADAGVVREWLEKVGYREESEQQREDCQSGAARFLSHRKSLPRVRANCGTS